MFKHIASATASIAAITLATAPAQAQAQYMMHLDPNLYIMIALQMSGGVNTCITGMALSDKKVEEVRKVAPAAMQAYFAAAQGGGKKSASFRISKKAQWTMGTIEAPLSQIDAQADPLAVAGNKLDPDMLRFFRAGDGQSALGQWLVNGPDAKAMGIYNAVLKREKAVWKLERLTVHTAAEAVAPAMQYCTVPGDVTEHRVKAATDQIAYNEKESAKAALKLEAAKAALARAAAALAGKSGSTPQREAIRTAKRDVETREARLADLRKGLTDSQEYLAKSNRDKAEIAALTLPPAEASRFRGFETTTAKEAATKRAEDEAKRKAEQEAKRAAKAR